MWNKSPFSGVEEAYNGVSVLAKGDRRLVASDSIISEFGINQ